MRGTTGRLIVIGGHEDKCGERQILRQVAASAGGGALVVATLASHAYPQELWHTYRGIFRQLGVRKVRHLDLDSRSEASHDPRLRVLEDARTVFFTGGDQLRVTSQVGGTAVHARLHEILARGGTIAGTSAGASVMSETMLVAGEGEATHRAGDTLRMAPGLGFLRGIIIDQHFAERGRIGRLLGAVAQNPGYLGIGIDENTAIDLAMCGNSGSEFEVLGSGAVYVVDGRGVTDSNMAEAKKNEALSLFNVRLHVLSQGDHFELGSRRPRSSINRRRLSRAA